MSKENNNAFSELVRTREQKLAAYIKSNPKPDQTVCPDLMIYWRGENRSIGKYAKTYSVKDGTIKVLEGDGESTADFKLQYLTRESWKAQTTWAAATGKLILGVYFKYIPELECLETSIVCIKGNRGEESVTRNWEYDTSRYFIFKDYSVYRFEKYWPNDGKYYNKSYCEFLSFISKAQAMNRPNVRKAVKDFTGISEYSGGSYDFLKDTSLVTNFLRFYRSQAKSSVSAKSKRQLELELVNLPEIDENQFNAYIESYFVTKEYRENTVNVVVCQNVDNNYYIFRIFCISYAAKNKNFSGAKEIGRLYVSKDGKPTLARINNNHIAITSSSVSNLNYASRYIYMGFTKESVKDFSPLKYIFDIIFELGEDSGNTYRKGEKILISVADLLRHPIVEQLWKAGYHNTAKALCIDGEIPNNLKRLFKVKEKKGVPLYTLLGVNKNEMKLVDQYCNVRAYGDNYTTRIYLSESALSFVRVMTEAERVSDINQNTFETLFNFSTKCSHNAIRPSRDLIYRVTELGRPVTMGWRELDVYTPHQKQCIKRVISLDAKCSNINGVSIFKDCVRIYCQLDDESRPNIDLYSINSERQLSEVHDNLVALNAIRLREQERLRALKTEERNKELEKKMKRIQEKRIEDFEFSDEEYSIIVPKRLSEITEEGINQSHCVGGYLEAVANGSTNILFLRRNGMKDKSFYTIEVSNHKHIVQIHGKANKWLGNNPEAIPFVIKWLKEKEILCDRQILLSESTHYGVGTQFLNGKQFGL